MDPKFIETTYFHEATSFVATDEVGRGCLAGPVTVVSIKIKEVSVANLEYLKSIGVGDSKKVSAKKRQLIIETLGLKIEDLCNGGLFIIDKEQISLSLKVVHISPERIDIINILQATFEGMNDSASGLLTASDLWLIDGNQAPKSTHPLIKTIIKGDSKSVLIGLASILAKEARDYLMGQLHLDFSDYDWNNNSGYGTPKHLDGIKKVGLSKHHRKTFSVNLSNR